MTSETPLGSPCSAATPRMATYTVLHIEDSPANQRLVERILAQRPAVELLTAGGGEAGLELARERGPDLVLLDLHLPDIPGEDVIRRLRESPATAGIPVVVMSGGAFSGQAGDLRALGVRAYLAKPFRLAELLDVVDGLLAGGDRT